jgi:hypothetical protein
MKAFTYPLGTLQTENQKKEILKQFVRDYQPLISLSSANLLTFQFDGNQVDIHLDNCIVASVTNSLFIFYSSKCYEIEFTITV